MSGESREVGLSIERSERELVGSEVVDLIQDDDGRVAAKEILRTIGRLMETLNTERKVVLASEDSRRSAEIDNARLRAELEAERQRREHFEAELKKVQSMVEERQERARAELDALWEREEARHREPEPSPDLPTPPLGPGESAPAMAPDPMLGQALLEVFEKKLSKARSTELDKEQQAAESSGQMAALSTSSGSAGPAEAAVSGRRPADTAVGAASQGRSMPARGAGRRSWRRSWKGRRSDLG